MRSALLAALALSAAPAAAFNLASGGRGTSGADFLNVGVGARPLSMGSAFTAVETDPDANAVNWNPAALALVQKPNVTASYNALFVDENQGYLGYSAPLKSGTGVWAAGFNYLIVSKIERRAGDTEVPDGTFNNSNYAASLSYARVLSDTWAAGGTLKYIREDLDSLKQNAMALDFGLQGKTGFEGLTSGFVVRNLGSNIGPDPLPLTLSGGLAYKLLNKRLLLSSDLHWLASERINYLSLGSEFWISPNLAARAGYQLGHGADQLHNRMVGLGVGLGLKFQRLTMDYAFLPYGDLGDTHRLTFGIRFD